MARYFKPFDNIPIVGICNMKDRSCSAREVVISAVAVLLLLLCCIFIGLYAKEVHEDGRDYLEEDYCTTKECTETAANSLKLMEPSVDPCDNFYEYACGNYKTYPNGSILGKMVDKNDDVILDILEKPPSRQTKQSYERKLSTFYRSCMDERQRDELLGEPFLDQVVLKLGGWNLFGAIKEDYFDFNNVLKIVQSDFGIDALYKVRIPIPFAKNEMLSIEPGMMSHPDYRETPKEDRKESYKAYIKVIATLLMRDEKSTNLTNAQKKAKIDELISDVLEVEEHLASIPVESCLTDLSGDNQITVGTLNKETGNVIDWKSQLAYMYRPADINNDTKVVVCTHTYFKKLATTIANWNRLNIQKLRNFLLWRCADKYAPDLSYEYFDAHQNFHNPKDAFNIRYKDYQNQCMRQSNLYLKEAVGALYIHEHLDRFSKTKAVNITKNLKRALVSEIDESTWMDEGTKKYAKSKLSMVTFKIGYPEWMADYEEIDKMYHDFRVNMSDFFGNLLGAIQFLRKRNVESFQHMLTRQEWRHDIIGVQIHYEPYWNEVTVGAGILQNPIYNRDEAHFKTFGSFGALVGQSLIHAVDNSGQHFNKKGEFLKDKSWWSSQTVEAYQKIETCAQDVYLAAHVPERNFTHYTALINGVKLALKGYKDWVKALDIKEKMLPGIELTDEQMILLSFAQSQCDNSVSPSDMDSYVNLILGQIQKFFDAFQCGAKSDMNPDKKCSFF